MNKKAEFKNNRKKNFLKIIIIQARSGSKRFPNKIFQKFFGIPYILNVIKSFNTKKFDLIVVAATNSKKDNKLAKLLKKNSFNFFRGNTNNLVLRYYNCALQIKKKLNVSDFKIQRVCADMPFIDDSMSELSFKMLNKKIDYVSYPDYLLDGYNVESFWFSSLSKLNKKKLTKFESEHIGPGFKNGGFKVKKIPKSYVVLKNKVNLSLDYKKDLKILRKIEKKISKKYKNKTSISYIQMAKLIKKNNFEKFFLKT